MKSNEAGALATIDGTALVTPEAGAYLLSLMEIIKENNGTFAGDKDGMTVRDGDGNILLIAKKKETISGPWERMT